MNLFANLEARLKTHLARMVADGRLPEGLPIDRITVEPPRDAAFWLTSNSVLSEISPRSSALNTR